MSNTITNADDVIDSRDIIERIEELESEMEDFNSGLHPYPWSKECPDDAAELLALRALAKQAHGYGDWENGETLIRESYFVEYAQELAEDIGAINREAAWPNNCIDWEAAASQLKFDYTEVDFDGVTYLMRT